MGHVNNSEGYAKIVREHARGKDGDYKKDCLGRILERVSQRETFLDLTAGLGRALLFAEHFHFSSYIGIEKDPETFQELNKAVEGMNVQTILGNSLESVFKYTIDVAFFDMNTFTQKMFPVVSALFDFLRLNYVKHIIFSDTASFYYRMRDGEKPYGAKTFEEYVHLWEKKFRVLKYKLKDVCIYPNKKVSLFWFERNE